MSSSAIEHLQRLELNENGWFSLWCETEDLELSRIFHNIYFIDDPLYNHATCLRRNEENAQSLIEEVIHFFVQKKINPCLYVPSFDNGLTRILIEKGFTIYDQMAVLEFADEPRQTKRSKIKVIEAGIENAAVWAKTFIQAFELPEEWRSEVFRRSSLAASHSETILLLGYLNDEPIGTVALYSNNRVAGIYCLGTLKAYRGMGVASFLICQAITRSKLMGSNIICLQTLGQDRLKSFYTKHGFKISSTRSIYIQPHI